MALLISHGTSLALVGRVAGHSLVAQGPGWLVGPDPTAMPAGLPGCPHGVVANLSWKMRMCEKTKLENANTKLRKVANQVCKAGNFKTKAKTHLF